MKRLLIIFLILAVANTTSGSHQRKNVEGIISDINVYFQNPSIVALIEILGNLVWFYLSPWIGGYTMVQAYSAFETNPGLYLFLGYTL